MNPLLKNIDALLHEHGFVTSLDEMSKSKANHYIDMCISQLDILETELKKNDLYDGYEYLLIPIKESLKEYEEILGHTGKGGYFSIGFKLFIEQKLTELRALKKILTWKINLCIVQLPSPGSVILINLQ